MFARKINKPIFFVPAVYILAWALALGAWIPGFTTVLIGDAGGDGSLTAWQLLWPLKKLLALFRGATLAPYLDGNYFGGLPGGGGYAFSDMMPGWLPLVGLLRVFTDNPVLIVNCIQALSLFLLPVSVYLLATAFHARRPEALAAGILASFTAYQFDMLLHLQMQFLFAPVFALYFQRRALDAAAIRPRLLAGWWLPLAWTLLVSPHLFLYGSLASLLMLVPEFTRQRRRQARRKLKALLRERRRLFYVLQLVFVVVSLLLCGALPYRSVGEQYGFERLKAEAYYGGLRLENFAHAPERFGGSSIRIDRSGSEGDGRASFADGGPHEKNVRVSPLVVWLFLLVLFRFAWRGKGRGGNMEPGGAGRGDRGRGVFGRPVFGRTVFAATLAALLFWGATLRARFGLVSVVCADLLILWAAVAGTRWLWRTFRFKKEVLPASRSKTAAGVSVFIALFILLAAFGPRPVLHNIELPWINPYNILYEFVPGFDRIRASSRIIVAFWVFFGIAAARGLRIIYVYLAALLRKTRARVSFLHGRAGLAAAGISAGLVLFVYFDAQPAQWRPAGHFESFQGVRALHAALGPAPGIAAPPSGQSSAGSILIVAPESGRTEQIEAASLFYSLRHGRTLTGGYSGVRVEPYFYLRSAVLDFFRGRGDWQAEQIQALLMRAGVERLFVLENDALSFREQSLPLNSAAAANDPSAVREKVRAPSTVCGATPGGSWRFNPVMHARQAFVLAFRPDGDFCVSEYGRYRDRRLSLDWQGPRELRVALRVSSPFYYHPAAPELLYAARGPGRRGEYEVILREGAQELHRQRVHVK